MPNLCLLFVAEVRLKTFCRLTGYRVYLFGDADFCLRLFQRFAAGIVLLLHVLHRFQQRWKGAIRFVGEFVLPVETIRTFNHSRLVIVGWGLWNGRRCHRCLQSDLQIAEFYSIRRRFNRTTTQYIASAAIACLTVCPLTAPVSAAI